MKNNTLTITLTEEEIRMIRISLDFRGDDVCKSKGEEEGKKYYDLANRFFVAKKQSNYCSFGKIWRYYNG